MSWLSRVILASTAFALVPSLASAQKEVAGATDHGLVGRYEGSIATFYESKAYEEVSLPAQPLERNMKDKSAWQIDLAGRVTSIRYEGPSGRSVLEVLRNYEAALKSKGFEIKFFCRGDAQCAPGRAVPTFWNAARGAIGLPSMWNTSTYLLAERMDGGGRVTVGVLGVETRATQTKPLMPHVAVTVVESKAMEAGKIAVVEAGAMQRAIERDGRIAIYGIYFDFDKAEVKPESTPQIEQLAALLKANPKLDVLIVGHTDAQGAFDYNLSLSQRRAQAVVDALVTGHGLDRKRLTPAGAGMVSPVATNRTEEGQAKNRRVEIVDRTASR